MFEERKFSFIPPASISNKVAAIKSIRMLTGMGLKEAKDAAEYVGREQAYALVTDINERVIEEQMRILRSEGFQVGPPVYQLLEELRKIGAQALVLAEKLRRKF